MRISIILIVILLMHPLASARASDSSECPKLDGAYTCRWSDWIEPFGWQISLDTDDGGGTVYRNVLYSFNSEGKKTDYISGAPVDDHIGHTIVIPDKSNGKSLPGRKVTPSCKNQKFLITMDYFDKNGKQYKEEVETYYLGSDGNLAETSLNPHHSLSCVPDVSDDVKALPVVPGMPEVTTDQQFHAKSVMSTSDLVKDLPSDVGAAGASKKHHVSGQTLTK
jgi:hypothetical protein